MGSHGCLLAHNLCKSSLKSLRLRQFGPLCPSSLNHAACEALRAEQFQLFRNGRSHVCAGVFPEHAGTMFLCGSRNSIWLQCTRFVSFPWRRALVRCTACQHFVRSGLTGSQMFSEASHGNLRSPPPASASPPGLPLRRSDSLPRLGSSPQALMRSSHPPSSFSSDKTYIFAP